MAMRIEMMAITTINSMRVKPQCGRRAHPTVCLLLKFALPLRIRGPIACLVNRCREHIEDVLPSPGTGLGVVLHAALAPIGVAGHGVLGHTAEKADLAGSLAVAGNGVRHLDSC